MRLRYRLERSILGQDWTVLGYYPFPVGPGAQGFAGQAHERMRVVCDQTVTELWEWSERVPVNPADYTCTDFVPGWKLLWRKDAPAPGADELAHFFQG